MLTIEMLPARHGDCLFIEYGAGAAVNRILVDGGPAFAYDALRERLQRMPKAERHFELFIITHIDADHIEGAVRLLGDPDLGVTFGEVWYNAWPQISNGMPASFGAESGEYLSALIPKRGLAWNTSFGQTRTTPKAVMAQKAVVALPGGAKLTLLSPTPAKLAKMRDSWEAELQDAGLEPGVPEAALERLKRSRRFKGVSFATPDPEALASEPFTGDSAAANGSSIACMLEAGGRRVLLGADAHPDVLEASIDHLLAGTGKARLAVHAVKLPHHGSKNNVSPALVAKLACRRWLFSSDGTFFDHPDPEAVSRVLTGAGRDLELCFNYRTKRTAMWDNDALMQTFRYRAIYPEAGKPGLVVRL